MGLGEYLERPIEHEGEVLEGEPRIDRCPDDIRHEQCLEILDKECPQRAPLFHLWRTHHHSRHQEEYWHVERIDDEPPHRRSQIRGGMAHDDQEDGQTLDIVQLFYSRFTDIIHCAYYSSASYTTP